MIDLLQNRDYIVAQQVHRRGSYYNRLAQTDRSNKFAGSCLLLVNDEEGLGTAAVEVAAHGCYRGSHLS